MKDIGRLLRDGDPVALEPEMSSADVQAVRRAVLAARATTHRATSRWPGPLFAGAAVTAALAAGVLLGLRTQAPRVSPIDTALTHASGAEGAHHLGLRFGVPSMNRMNVMLRVGSLAGLAAAVTLAGVATASAQSPAPVKVAPASPQGYSVVLVLGDVQNASAGDNNVPPAARKALGDMKDFLPYKSYRLLDAQWILGSQRTVSRLRGANEQEYELTLRGVVVAGGKLSVNFRLAEPGPVVGVKPAADADSRAGRRASLEDALRAAEAEAERLRTSSGEKRAETVAASREKIAAIQKELEQEKALRDAVARAGGRSIIDTNFMMDVGETVVVGTSRVAGDKALIALLTAVAHAGK